MAFPVLALLMLAAVLGPGWVAGASAAPPAPAPAGLLAEVVAPDDGVVPPDAGPEPSPIAPEDPSASPSPLEEGGQEIDGPVVVLQGIVRAVPEGAEERETIPDVAFTVESEDGTFSSEAETDEDGRWSVEAPAGGSFVVTIDPDTLPDGVALRDEDGASRTVSPSISPFNVIFRFGEARERDVASFGSRAAALFVAGVRLGLVLAMAAIGLSLIFGTTGLTNFAHGELITLGAVIAWILNVTIGIPFLLAAPLAVAAGGIIGFLTDKGLFAPLRRRGTGLIAQLVVTIGLSLFGRYAIQWRFGGQPKPYASYSAQAPYDVFGISIIPRDLVVMAVSVIVLVSFGLALQRTRLGKATRAVSDNPALAAASGIDVEQVINRVWVIGTALAALGGVFLGLSERVQWNIGFIYLLLVFSAVILGGLGTAFGAMVGALVIGILVQMSTLFVPTELQTVVALGVLILVLIVRPQGLLGRSERVG